MNGENRHFYSFKSFRLDVEERQLLHENSPVALTPKAFDVLVALVERSGHLVEKNELLEKVWADSFVEEINVARIVHTLRKALGDDGNGNKFIETVAKKGYRFVAEVEQISKPEADWSAKTGAQASPLAMSAEREKTFADSQLLENEQTFADTTVLENHTPFAPPENGDAWQAVTPALQSAPRLQTEEQPAHQSKKRFVLFAVGFASAVCLLLLLSFNFSSESSVNPNEVKSIAVLPLKSLSDENRDARYELGIADALIQKISPSKNLIVRQLSAVQDYADSKKDAVAIGREQKVDYVLAANYQIADGKIRITAQWINVATGATEATFKDERDAANIFALQDVIAANFGQKILTKLNRTPSDIAVKRYTTSEEAYRLYLQGRILTEKRNRKDAEKAVEYLQKAVELDANFALGYAQLATAHSTIANFGGNKHEHYGKAKAAIEKSLSLDENLAEAYANLGEIKLNEWDFEGAETALKKAVALDPNSGNAHKKYALYLNSMGRFDESIEEAKIAIDLEPASVLNHKNYAQFLYFARRYDESADQALRTVEMDPNFRVTYGWLINSYKMKGEDDKAFEWFLKSPAIAKTNPEMIPVWKEIYAKSGWRGVNERQLQDAEDWEKPMIYSELGDKENTILSLEKNFKNNERGWMWTTIKINPRYDFIRSDPRFENLVRRGGLK